MATTKPGDGHTPVTDGIVPASWGEDVNLAIEELIDRERRMIVPFVLGTSSYAAWNTRYAVMQLSSGMVAYAHWTMPANFASLTAVYLVFGAYDGTAGVIDISVYYAGDDESSFGTHGATTNNHALTPTANDVYVEDITGSLFANLAAGDVVGLIVTSDAGDPVHLKLMHLAIDYRAF